MADASPVVARRRRRSGIRGLALFIAIILIVASFQMNTRQSSAPLVYLAYYAVLAAAFLVVASRPGPIVFVVALALVLVLVVGGGLPKALGLGIGLYLGWIGLRRHERAFARALKFLLLVNLALIAVQFFGLTELAYRYTNYANVASPLPPWSPRFGTAFYLPQFRPSGMFPSPTYISAFSILLFTTVCMSARGWGPFSQMLTGVMLALVGSSVGLFLAVIAVPMAFVRSRLFFLLAGYVGTMVPYVIFLPQQFFYNFNVRELVASVSSRLGIGPAQVAGESVLQTNLLAAVILVIAPLLAILPLRRFGNVFELVPLGIAVALPVMVHDLTRSLFYWFLLGATAAGLVNSGAFSRQPRPSDSPVRPRRIGVATSG